jgi:integrase
MSEIGMASSEDYLFLPQIKNRKIAGPIMISHFNKILFEANLKFGPLGQKRSLYSLRHTAIMFRLLYGQGIDLLTLARNSRTSVQMIEQFYASNLNAEMNIQLLQSKRTNISKP